MHIATKGSKIDISSEKKTEEVAKIISSKIKPGNIVFLYGEMGVGKTTFVYIEIILELSPSLDVNKKEIKQINKNII